MVVQKAGNSPRCLKVGCPHANHDLYSLLLREYLGPILTGQKTAVQAGKDVQPLVREALAKV